MKGDQGKKAGFPHVRFMVDKTRRGSYTITMIRQRVAKPQKLNAQLGAKVKTTVSGELDEFWVQEGAQSESELEGGSQETVGTQGSHTESKARPAHTHKVEKMAGSRHESETTRMKGMLASLKGQIIIARDKEDGIYYEGVVVSCPNPRYATVKRHQDDKITKLSTRFLLPIRGAISTPPLRVGDYVLVKVMNMSSAAESYIPGIIQMPGQRGTSYYTVLVYNGQTIVTMRRHLVKISKERFDFTVDYICQVLREDSCIYGKKSPPDPDIKMSVHCDSGVVKEPDIELSCSGSSGHSSPPSTPTQQHRQHRKHDREVRDDSLRRKSDDDDDDNDDDDEIESLHGDLDIYSTGSSPTSSQSTSPQRTSAKSTSTNQNTSCSMASKEKPAGLTNNGSIMEKKNKSADQYRERRSKGNHRQPARDSESYSTLVVSDRSSPTSLTRGSTSNRSGGVTARLKEHEDRLREMQRKLQQQDEKHRGVQEDLKRKIEEVEQRQKEKRHQLEDKKNECRGEEGASMSGEFKEERSADGTGGTQARTDDRGGNVLALLKMRKSLAPIRVQEEVLARWSDEGWYYRGIVKMNCQDFSYMVVDSTGEVEQIWREDIITERDDAGQIIKVGDKVIGLHPSYSFSYAPAKVTDCPSSLIQVCFYDNQVTELQRDEVYKINHLKHTHDVQELHKCETQWLGQAVVARDDNTGVYHIGCVQEKITNKQLYKIEWCDGTTCTQSPVHMFGAFTRRHKMAVGDKLLAVQDGETLDYLPGWIISKEDGRLRVRFCNGFLKTCVIPEESYWLSTDYFDKAVIYFNKKNKHIE